MKVFKKCSCGIEYKSKEYLIATCEFVGPWTQLGLDLYNCECKSTMAIEQFDGAIKAARERFKEENKNKEGEEV